MEVSSSEGTPGVWRTDMTYLLGVFREALQVLVPVVRKARIDHEQEFAYDDWDDIAQNLYRNIVERSARSAIGLTDDLELPQYDTLFDAYTQAAMVVMRAPDIQSAGHVVFHSFASRNELFDTTLGVAVDESYQRTAGFREWRADTVQFALLYRSADRTQVLERLDIVL